MRLEVVLTGRASQRKGRAGELELTRLLQGCGYDVQPGRAVSYGATPDISGLPGIHIECKRAEQLRPYDWMAQAERDAVRFGDGLPAVFFRRSRSPWLVVMKLGTGWSYIILRYFRNLVCRQIIPVTAFIGSHFYTIRLEGNGKL